MKVTIRRAAAEDAAAIADCLAALWYGTSAALVAARLAAAAESAVDTALVAESPSDGIVGVVSVHLLPLFHTAGNLARLTALAVRPEHQRKGVGRALVTAAEQFAWEHQCGRVEVTSGDHRENAHVFYQTLGYSVDERRFIKHRSPGGLTRA
jgi:GNAT superfamily N-acetyltransferase